MSAKKSRSYSVQDVLSWRPCERYDAVRYHCMFGDQRVTIEMALDAEYDKVADLFWLILRDEFLTPSEQKKIFKWTRDKILNPKSETWIDYSMKFPRPMEDLPNAIKAMIGSLNEFSMVEMAGWAVVEFIRELIGRNKNGRFM
jgi:hypothetical protein